MTNRVQTLRSSVAGNRPATGTRAVGELYVNMADNVLGYINAAQVAIDLTNRGVFVGDVAPASPIPGQLWYDSLGGQMYVWYDDGSSQQWVIVVNNAPDLTGYAQLSGATFTGPLSGTSATFSGPITPSTTAGIIGTTLGDDAVAGSVGEVKSDIITTGVPLATGSMVGIAGIPLEPGDWDVFAELWVQFSAAGATSLIGGISTTVGVAPGLPAIDQSRLQISSTLGAGIQAYSLPACRANVSVPVTNFYLDVSATFASGTANAFGKLWARRAR